MATSRDRRRRSRERPASRGCPPRLAPDLRPYAPHGTIVYAALLATIFVLLLITRLSEEPAGRFRSPVETSLRAMHAHMVMHEAAAAMSDSWNDAFLRWLVVGGEQSDAELVIDMLRDLAPSLGNSFGDFGDETRLRANLAVVLAELGRTNEAVIELEGVAKIHRARPFVEQFNLAYATGAPALEIRPALADTPESQEPDWMPPGHPLDAVALLGAGWARWRFGEKLATARGDLAAAARHAAHLNEAVHAHVVRTRMFAVAALLLVLGGLASLALLLHAARRGVHAPAPIFWQPAEAWGLTVRAYFWGFVLSVVMVVAPLLKWTPIAGSMIWLGVPAIWLLWHRYWRHAPDEWRTFVGWPESLPVFQTLVLAGWAAFGIDAIIALGAERALWAFGEGVSWTDVVHEDVVDGTAASLALLLIEGCITGPIVEELLFRGLLFGALRASLSFWPAALISSALFGAVHFYSLEGCVVVAAGGFIYAWIREKTGSLWPAVIAHGLSNLIAIGGAIFLYT